MTKYVFNTVREAVEAIDVLAMHALIKARVGIEESVNPSDTQNIVSYGRDLLVFIESGDARGEIEDKISEHGVIDFSDLQAGDSLGSAGITALHRLMASANARKLGSLLLRK